MSCILKNVALSSENSLTALRALKQLRREELAELQHPTFRGSLLALTLVFALLHHVLRLLWNYSSETRKYLPTQCG